MRCLRRFGQIVGPEHGRRTLIFAEGYEFRNVGSFSVHLERRRIQNETSIEAASEPCISGSGALVARLRIYEYFPTESSDVHDTG